MEEKNEGTPSLSATETAAKTGRQAEDNPVDVLSTLKELKENSVDKSKYNKLADDYAKLVRGVASGEVGNYHPLEQSVPKATIKDLRTAVQRHDQSNLEYWSNQLNLRDALIASGHRDPWLQKKKINGQQVTKQDAEEQANTIREIIELSAGSDDMFTAILGQALKNGGSK